MTDTSPYEDPQHLANTADAMGKTSAIWQKSTAKYHFKVRDTLRAQAARIAQLEAEVARLREAQSQAATDVLAERARQVSVEGWTPEHDDAHASGEMAGAASCYGEEDRDETTDRLREWRGRQTK